MLNSKFMKLQNLANNQLQCSYYPISHKVKGTMNGSGNMNGTMDGLGSLVRK